MGPRRYKVLAPAWTRSYSYRYTAADLVALRDMLTIHPRPGYLMFNNFSSKSDALRFRQLF